ncbi:hypothetical protein [Hutsoniella sourekii]|uniref:hypothetical protein n=1 Tax=Hutsoniella sourekii TaxID=87650 RepID=UPI000486BA74|nr:hypothetical protein [Hutsoniella sourekii]
MTTKDKIYDALNGLGPFLSYGDSDNPVIPRIHYFLLANISVRLSNKRHTQMPIYQVDYFSDIPLNVEDAEILSVITESLEKINLTTSDWREVISYNEDEDRTDWHYFVEVR